MISGFLLLPVRWDRGTKPRTLPNLAASALTLTHYGIRRRRLRHRSQQHHWVTYHLPPICPGKERLEFRWSPPTMLLSIQPGGRYADGDDHRALVNANLSYFHAEIPAPSGQD